MKWVECPRDSWQGFRGFVPTEEKVRHLHGLLDAGFRHLDLTSFVSPRWVPQHADAREVLAALPEPAGREYLAIIANPQGLERALQTPKLSAVGYPFSLSETFQRKNVNAGVEASWAVLDGLLREARGKHFVVYLSMAFGNPYGDFWEPGLTAHFARRMLELDGLAGVVLADTYGVATPQTIAATLGAVSAHRPQGLTDPPIGLHLHSRPEHTLEKVQVALDAGVTWLEGALGGIGGCPFAGDELVGNLATEQVLPHLAEKGLETGVDLQSLAALARQATALRTQYA